MLRRILVPLGLLSILAAAVAWQLAGTVRAEMPRPPVVDKAPGLAVSGRYELREGQRVLTLWGTPRERGFAHGYLLAESIVRGIEHDFERVLKPLIPTYESIIRRGVVPKFAFEPRELEELEGLYEGLKAKLPPEQRVVKGLGREFDLVDIKALNTFGDWYGLGCSSLAVWGDRTKDGAPLVGRNFDFPGFFLLIEHQYVVVRAPEGEALGQVGVAYPGSIGVMTGMNEAGVFLAVHDVRIKPTLDKAMRPNVPRLLAARRILEQASGSEACDQALALARGWPTLYGNNFMVVAPSASKTAPHAAVLEYDCRSDMEGGCTLRRIDAEGDQPDTARAMCLTCTNHHRCRVEPDGYKDLHPRWRFPLLSDVAAAEVPDGRFDVMGLFAHINRVSFPREGVQRLATALRGEKRAHGTLHQVVGEPAVGRLHIRLGQVGRHIRDMAPRPYAVGPLVRQARAR